MASHLFDYADKVSMKGEGIFPANDAVARNHDVVNQPTDQIHRFVSFLWVLQRNEGSAHDLYQTARENRGVQNELGKSALTSTVIQKKTVAFYLTGAMTEPDDARLLGRSVRNSRDRA